MHDIQRPGEMHASETQIQWYYYACLTSASSTISVCKKPVLLFKNGRSDKMLWALGCLVRASEALSCSSSTGVGYHNLSLKMMREMRITF